MSEVIRMTPVLAGSVFLLIAATLNLFSAPGVKMFAALGLLFVVTGWIGLELSWHKERRP